MENTESHRYFRENSPTVTSDYADGEVVILNLETGAYYGLDSTGAVIWMGLLAGNSLESTIIELFGPDAVEKPEIVESVNSFLQELLTESLLLKTPASESSNAEEFSLPSGLDFVAPQLNKYTDMNELLLIDPVHEVDDRGWPNTEPEST